MDYRSVGEIKLRILLGIFRSVEEIKLRILLGMHRSVENRCHKKSHAVRYATGMFQNGCIPYGMQGRDDIQFSTERYIPMECSTNYNSVFNLSYLRF